MMKKTTKKLTMNKATLRALSSDRIARAVGGRIKEPIDKTVRLCDGGVGTTIQPMEFTNAWSACAFCN